MTWKQDPNQLSKKMFTFIDQENGDVTYSQLQERASNNGIDLDVLDQALTKLHRFKKISRRVKGDDIVYKSIVPKKPVFGSHLTWVRENYPRPEKFVMPFPEIDMSFIVLPPEEIEKFKAEQNGRTFIPKRQYRKKKV